MEVASAGEPSPAPSDSTQGGWQPVVWEDEASLRGLARDTNRKELLDLVEDKEIAAHAVAFVVNSTRKGIVPLCADVANLMRAKKCLESKVSTLKSENESLRQSHMGSAALSSPTSLRSFLQYPQATNVQEGCCSRGSSHCSGMVSSSPRLLRQRSPHHPSTLGTHAPSAFTLHQPNCSSTPQAGGPITGHKAEHMRGHHRKGSLPEMVSEPLGNITKVMPRAVQVSQGTQCGLDDAKVSRCMQEQLQAMRQKNVELEAELLETRHQLSVLRETADECNTQTGNQKPEKFQLVNEFDVAIPAQESHRLAERRSSATLIIPVFLEGCLCHRCAEVSFTDNAQSGMTHSQISSSLQVSIDDYVATKDNRVGKVRYIGHVDDLGQADGVYVGLELNKPDGSHHGFIKGKRYFTCAMRCGAFVPVREIMQTTRPESCSSKSDTPSNPVQSPATGPGAPHINNHRPGDLDTRPQEASPGHITRESTLSLKLPRDIRDTVGDLV